MKFMVKTLDGKSQHFDVSGEMLVLQLKQKVQESLGIPTSEQRMILSGKVLKDEDQLSVYTGIEGKVIHVVKYAPPKAGGGTTPAKPQDYMYVGVSPKLPPPKEVAFLQDLAKDDSEALLQKVHQGGHPASMVTVTIHTLDNDGRPIQSATHTATTHSYMFTPESELAQATPTLPQPEPGESEEDLKKRREELQQRDRERARLNRYRERIRRQQQEGREQTNILEIYQNMTSVRRAIQGADNILEEYFASEQYIEAKEKLEHSLALKEQQKREDATSDSVTSDNNGLGDGMTMHGKDLETRNKEEPKDDPKNPQYSLGEDGRPRQHIITDTGMLLPAGSHLYAALVDDIMRLQRRGLELHEFYNKKMYAEETYEIEEYPVNEKLINTVYRYQNAMSQAYSAIKKVRVMLEGQPPRIVSLLPVPRSRNPLLSLLTQSTEDGPSAAQPQAQASGGARGGEGEGDSLASLLGTLMTARAMMGMMEDDDDDDDDKEEGGAKEGGAKDQPTITEVTEDTKPQDGETDEKMDVEPSTSATSDGATGGSGDSGSGGGATGEGESGEGGATGGDKSKKKKKKDEGANPFMPGPVQLLQEIMKERKEKEKKEQEKRTVVIQPSSSFFDTVSKIRQAIGGPEGEIMPPTLIGDLVEQCMKQLTMMEVVTIFSGTPDPLKSIHPLLRVYLQEKLLNNEEPTLENIPQAIAKAVEGLPDVLRGITPPLPLRCEVDFPLSAQKCCEHVLKEAFELIISTPDDSEDFGQKIYDWANKAGTLLTCVLRECLESSNDLETSMMRVTKMAFPDNDQPGVLSMLNSRTLVETFMEQADKATYTTADLEVYIVPSPEGEEEMEVGGAGDQPPTEQSSSDQQQQQQQSSDESFPPALPKEWIPTLQQDKAEMARTKTHPPLSAAYLSGMPTKKRKLESGEVESVRYSDILVESLEAAIEESGAKPISGSNIPDIVKEAESNSNLVQEMGVEFHSIIKRRLEEDQDYSPENFPASQQLYNPEKK